MSKKSRDKGQRGERQVAKIMSEWWGSDFTRTPSSGGFRTKKFRDDWNASADLVTPDETFPFCVEVKNAEGWNLEQLIKSSDGMIWTWWDQTVNQCTEGKIPLLCFTRNRQPWFYMIQDCAMGGIAWVDNPYMSVWEVNRGITVQIGLLSDLCATKPPDWTIHMWAITGVIAK